MDNIFILVPTLNPDIVVTSKFIEELHHKFKNILVVNDGSNKSYNQFFKSLEKKGILVFNHYKNLGKGRAIKNGFNYLLEKYPQIEGVVTCDSDGQHSVKDIMNIAKCIKKNPDKLILGVRDFNKENVPFKSRYGNVITRNIFKIFIGLSISDTQTGLRGFSKDLMNKLLDLAGERYEYETNMLIYTKEENIPIYEVEIETIYLDNNANSHFNPILDSILIYKLFMKYFLASFSSFLLDIILFCSMLNILPIKSKILAATILARVVSSIYNYLVNANLVFKNMNVLTLLKYYILVIIMMFTSGCFVTYLYNLLNINIIVIKVLVDFILWIINLIVQREFVFKEDK